MYFVRVMGVNRLRLKYVINKQYNEKSLAGIVLSGFI